MIVANGVEKPTQRVWGRPEFESVRSFNSPWQREDRHGLTSNFCLRGDNSPDVVAFRVTFCVRILPGTAS